jgi:uncharacterized lipoprotein YajG
MKKQLPLLALTLLAVVMLAGCAAGPNPAAHTAGTDGSIAGFNECAVATDFFKTAKYSDP